jgi:hypothetical protein
MLYQHSVLFINQCAFSSLLFICPHLRQDIEGIALDLPAIARVWTLYNTFPGNPVINPNTPCQREPNFWQEP